MPWETSDDAQDVADEQIDWWLECGIQAREAMGIIRPACSAVVNWQWDDVCQALKADWRRMKRGD